MKFLLNENIAHRGLHSIDMGIYENTMEAFQRAIKYSFPIELDVRVTKDNNIVVFHDDSLERMVGVNKYVYDLTLNELKMYNIKNSQSKIPTLKEVFDFVDDRIPILIEIKINGNILKTFNSLKNVISNYKGKIAIQSFHPLILILIKHTFPKIYRGQISSDFKNYKIGKIKKFIFKNMLFNFITKPHFIAYNIEDMPKRRLINLRKKGIYIFGWTIRNINQYNIAKKYCDSIIFENNEVLEYIST